MESIKVITHNAKDTFGCPFFVGWGTGVPSVAPHTEGVAELGSHSPRAAVGERLGAPAFLFEFFSGGASPSPTVRKEHANHGAKRSYPSANP